MSHSTQTFKIFLFSVIVFCISITGCASRSHVADNYKDVLKDAPELTRRTVVVFLIDGLSEQTLQFALVGMPHLRSFFKTERGLFRAHAPFPSLTFPGISSLLKERPVSQTTYIGNSFYYDGEIVDFEKPLRRKSVGDLMENDTVFSRLRAKGQRTVSLDYGLGINASTYTPIEDFSSAFSIAQGDYSYADAKKIQAVELLLSQNRPENWPSLVFIHLVGVDFLAHTDGPLAATTVGYLMALDEKIKPLLDILQQHEKKHQVISLLTADHGFSSKINYILDLENVLQKIVKKSQILNEARMAAIFLRDQRKANYVAQKLLTYKGIEIIGLKTKLGFSAQGSSKKINVTIQKSDDCSEDKIAISIEGSKWICPNALSADNPFGYPFFLSNLAHYFAAKNSPDLVIIPDHETAFLKGYVGYHGGPTAEETLVPVLLRNSQMSPGQAPPLWRLLPQLLN